MSTASVNLSLRNEVKLGSNCVICKDCVIQGDVTIGNGTIVHPRALIIAEAGPIVIGEHNLIEEKAMIINSGGSSSGSNPVMVIGNFNVFEVGSRCESLKIGDNNVFESKSFVGKGVVVSNNCIIGAGCNIQINRVLAEFSNYYGRFNQLTITQGHQPQVLQMEFLHRVLPSYHYLMKKKKNSEKETVFAPAI